ncbi:protein FAM32A-like [Vulpes vulpes]|uniref:Protein FAM32A n=1 Tax=Vulpes vulpes TaxID=9627 RepID=A0ABM5B1Y2_VULVU
MRRSGYLVKIRSQEKASSIKAAYEQVQKGLLKLKGVAELGVTKRKKIKKDKDKDKAKLLEAMGTSKKNKEEKRHGLDKRTPAQAAFEKMQEKQQMERILKKASKTHKQRVEDFNRHLDTLTEHYDIPKVSWTK